MLLQLSSVSLVCSRSVPKNAEALSKLQETNNFIFLSEHEPNKTTSTSEVAIQTCGFLHVCKPVVQMVQPCQRMCRQVQDRVRLWNPPQAQSYHRRGPRWLWFRTKHPVEHHFRWYSPNPTNWWLTISTTWPPPGHPGVYLSREGLPGPNRLCSSLSPCRARFGWRQVPLHVAHDAAAQPRRGEPSPPAALLETELLRREHGPVRTKGGRTEVGEGPGASAPSVHDHESLQYGYFEGGAKVRPFLTPGEYATLALSHSPQRAPPGTGKSWALPLAFGEGICLLMHKQ